MSRPCPVPATIEAGCGGCTQQVLLAIRYLGVLRCWTPADGSCSQVGCCPQLVFDPWPDLRAGLWTSSIAVPIYLDCPVGRRFTTYLLVTFRSPLSRRILLTGTSSTCGSTQVATLTVFDDSTYTLT